MRGDSVGGLGRSGEDFGTIKLGIGIIHWATDKTLMKHGWDWKVPRKALVLWQSFAKNQSFPIRIATEFLSMPQPFQPGVPMVFVTDEREITFDSLRGDKLLE
jgi:hypothetical protein